MLTNEHPQLEIIDSTLASSFSDRCRKSYRICTGTIERDTWKGEALQNFSSARPGATGTSYKIIEYGSVDQMHLDLAVLRAHGISMAKAAEKPLQCDLGELSRPPGGSRYHTRPGKLFLEPSEIARAVGLSLSPFDQFLETVSLGESERQRLKVEARQSLQSGTLQFDKRGSVTWEFDQDGNVKNRSIGAATETLTISCFDNAAQMAGLLAALADDGIRPIQVIWRNREAKGSVTFTSKQAATIKNYQDRR